MDKAFIKYFLSSILICSIAFPSYAVSKKKKNATCITTEIATKKRSDIKHYDEIITKDAKTCKGLMTLHLIKSKLYIEVPYSVLKKPMLMAGRVSKISDNRDVVAGRMPTDPLTVYWESDNEKAYLHYVNIQNICNSTEAIAIGVKRNNMDPVIKSFPIITINNDSTAFLIEATNYVCQDKAPFTPIMSTSAFAALFGQSNMKGKFAADNSGVIDIQAFPKNVNIITRMSFDMDKMPFTAQMTISFLLLPENVMRPRLANRAIDYFSENKTVYSENNDFIKNVKYINRWNIAPKPEDIEKHKRGELVEPQKPIIYYIDPAFPDKWRPWLKQGIEDWQMAFEKIGFKNAIVAKDYPNDPNFNPDDIRNTCLIYSSSQTANAMGPSWTDPRSGEIIQGSVYFFHNVLSLLHNWRFIQTAAADPSARAANYDMNVMGPLLRYLIVHEVGHTLGLMHNMRGSYAFPVDSLRSPSFTSEYGTTASIMDYARYNYVAQPGDGVTHFLTPRLGLFDYFSIEWAYKPIYGASTPEEEIPILQSWIDAKGDDPVYIFGPQSLFGASDPASQSESLGDDAIKASLYGIKNLKIINDSLINWIGVKDDSYKLVKDTKTEIYNQFKRYIGHVRVYITGHYDRENRIGDGKPYYEIVPKQKQRDAVNFILEQTSDFPNWFVKKEIDNKFSIKNEEASNLQISTLRSMMMPGYISRVEYTSKFADPEERYTADGYLADIYNYIWKSTINNKVPTWNEQRSQVVFIQCMMNGMGLIEKPSGSNSLFNIDIDEYKELYPYEFYEYNNKMYEEQVEMKPIDTKFDNDVKMYVPMLNHKYLMQVKKLLESKIPTVKGDLANHYKYILYEINNTLNN